MNALIVNASMADIDHKFLPGELAKCQETGEIEPGASRSVHGPSAPDQWGRGLAFLQIDNLYFDNFVLGVYGILWALTLGSGSEAKFAIAKFIEFCFEETFSNFDTSRFLVSL